MVELSPVSVKRKIVKAGLVEIGNWPIWRK
jgi:hypothetical protein